MINALVVVYNKTAENSATCMSLLKQEGCSVNVYLWDNSDSDFNLKESCKSYGWTYLGGKGNVGLSKAYNETVTELLKETDGNDCFCPLDDDTDLPEDYFCRAEAFVKENEGKISAPIVCEGGGILSPWRDGTIRLRRCFNNEQDCIGYEGKKLLAFNTGMLIPLSLFKNKSIRYDERLFVDGVDAAFIRNAKRQGAELCVFPVKLGGSFSAKSIPTEEKALMRFISFTRDTRILYENSKLFGSVIILKRGLHLSVVYKNPKFLETALRNEVGR